MATREEIKSEVEKVPEERLEELYRVVRTFLRENSADNGEQSLMAKLRSIQIEGTEDMSVKADLSSDDSDDLSLLAQGSLERAYGEDEPEYSLDLIKELNPEYERR